jgi:hypothetical protein
MQALRPLVSLLLVAVVTLASGCAITLPPPTASADTVRALRDADIQPMRVGAFTVDAANTQGSSVSLRGNSVAPAQGNFADHLAQAARAELAAAGKLDEKSARVLSGVLVRNDVDASGVSVGTANHVARFRLDVEGKRVYEKEQRVDGLWDSSFMGAVAIPAAVNGFSAGFQKLLQKLFTDPEFLKAAR